ncbi:cysteine/glutathione ABC transporter ATP-binding protein/permease CydC [Endozoicomonas sp. SCSIO W0465]|uniref:heme ABC transporter ATP-binding protein/permease CydC n=1 Tax=Endozoicomonas sp. SCSIO W0465 TaxID=2918516 RepID=UPI00207604E5|nr:cysteine/glutathione ABC transporter ATP-binding protein/permease CydC [Endozoicomonas sp. SCSIO W0465]USE39083.1 cysteine/glutathione ABC transporter ATP-binding protein/permease CydC [Endozoicomonas sp. SCSIO W0465]
MMNDLWPFLKLYRQHLVMLSLGVLLAIVTLLTSLSLLSLSGWFITATAIAGLTFTTAQSFNFFTPGAGVRGFSIARTAARYAERLVSHDATFRLLSGLRSWFFSKLIPVSQEQLGQYRKGELLDRLVADIDALDQLYLRLVSPLLSAVIVALLFSLFISFFSATVALAVLLVMMLWIVSVPLLFYVLGRRTGESMGVRQARLRQEVLDYLQGMAEQQIYGSDANSRATIAESEDQLVQDQSRMAVMEGLGSALFVSGSGAAALLVLYIASGEMSSGLFNGPVMVMMVFGMLASFEALMPLPVAFQFLGHTRHAASRLRRVVNLPVVVFPEKAAGDVLQGEIQFTDVSCGYSNEQPVINQLSLTIPAGSHVALLGKTGCGKSTLIKLLNRGLEPIDGQILLDGQVIQGFTEQALYRAITFVPQKTHVFSATFRENLLLAAPAASDEALLEAVKRSGLNRLAAARENHGDLLDIWLGQGGIALSGGEQRRLALARAMLKPAPILVMDEPGEGLDVHSEQTLMDTVFRQFKHSTIILITHKTTALERMGEVYRMENGCLTNIGSL